MIRWMQPLALRRRIAVLVAFTVVAAVLCVSAAAFTFTKRQLTEQTDATLVADARAAIETSTVLQSRSVLSLPFQIVNGSGQITGRGQDFNLPVDGHDANIALTQTGQEVRTVTINNESYRIVTLPYYNQTALQVAESLAPQDEALHKLLLLLLFVSLGGTALATAAGVAIARAALRPIRALTSATERVARTDDLGPAIALSGNEPSDDEIVRLTQSYNQMMAALAQSRERQRALVMDAGHELRTPLTSLRTNLELLAREDPAAGKILPPEDRARLLADLTAQAQELTALVGDLTAIAREEGAPAAAEDVDLAEVATRAVQRVRLRAPGVRIVSELEPSPVLGRPALLERAVTNLLDNAVKWSPEGGEVFVGLRAGQLVVADQGPGIAAEDLPHVFERFYRASSAREQPGSGLGLAIVAQAAKEHGGSAAAETLPGGGTLMRLSVPLRADAGLAPSPIAMDTPSRWSMTDRGRAVDEVGNGPAAAGGLGGVGGLGGLGGLGAVGGVGGVGAFGAVGGTREERGSATPLPVDLDEDEDGLGADVDDVDDVDDGGSASAAPSRPLDAAAQARADMWAGR